MRRSSTTHPLARWEHERTTACLYSSLTWQQTNNTNMIKTYQQKFYVVYSSLQKAESLLLTRQSTDWCNSLKRQSMNGWSAKDTRQPSRCESHRRRACMPKTRKMFTAWKNQAFFPAAWRRLFPAVDFLHASVRPVSCLLLPA